MTMAILKCIWFVSCLQMLNTRILAQNIFGISGGFLTNCPGTDLPAEIPSIMLNGLIFVVYKNQSAGDYRQNYMYSQAVSGIANDPMIDWSMKTVMYIPGYLESTRFPLAGMVGQAYSNQGYNVILLDTTRFTVNPYPVAARMASAVGENAASILANLIQYGLNAKTLELVGLSLGAQTAGFIGKQFQALTSTKISRITALDPAGPCFRNLPASSRLDSSDADFVDVVHTNVDGLGGTLPWGHIDFYVNGGKYQPPSVPGMPCLAICSHLRSLFLWVEAVQAPNTFIAIKCDSQQQAENSNCYNRSPMETNTMGLSTNKNLPGIYQLNTSNKYPYALGQRGLSRQV